MKRKTLRVIEGKNKTVILKTPKPILCAIAIISLILIAVLPFCIDKVLEIIRLKEAKALVFFIVYTVCVVSNLAIIVRLFLEKTVLDTQKKQLLLYTPFCHTKNFSDIADIEVFHADGGDGDAADGPVGEQEPVGQLGKLGHAGQPGQDGSRHGAGLTG